MDTGREQEGGRFLSREELARQNEQLRKELRLQREENDLLAGMLAQRFDEMEEDHGEIGSSGTETSARLSEEAASLFEVLPETFTIDEALDATEQMGLSAEDGVRHLRRFLLQTMVIQEAAFFVKIDHRL